MKDDIRKKYLATIREREGNFSMLLKDIVARSREYDPAPYEPPAGEIRADLLGIPLAEIDKIDTIQVVVRFDFWMPPSFDRNDIEVEAGWWVERAHYCDADGFKRWMRGVVSKRKQYPANGSPYKKDDCRLSQVGSDIVFEMHGLKKDFDHASHTGFWWFRWNHIDTRWELWPPHYPDGWIW